MKELKNWAQPTLSELDVKVTAGDWLYKWGEFYVNDSQLDPSVKNYVSYFRQSAEVVS